MANYPEFEYDGSDSELYSTDNYGGTDADIDNTTPVDATDGYTSDIDLTQKTYAVIDFKFLTIVGATDDLLLTLYKRRDSSWGNNEIAIDSKQVTNNGSENIYHYTIDALDFGPGHYRFAMQSTGTTDTFDIDVNCRYSRFEIATS